eukprot:3636775-Rhodomonas_salina.1
MKYKKPHSWFRLDGDCAFLHLIWQCTWMCGIFPIPLIFITSADRNHPLAQSREYSSHIAHALAERAAECCQEHRIAESVD